MIVETLFLMLLLAPQENFSRFSYCHDSSRGVFETQCVHLDPSGAGEVRFKRRGADEVQSALTLSAPGRERFVSVLAGTNFLAEAKSYESKRKVADLGRKRLTLEMASGKREAEFNFSELKEVTALVTFFDSMLSQQTFVFDLETAMQYDRLSVPKRLDDLDRELKAGRIADPPALVPILEKIDGDARIVNYARTHARKLKEEIQAGK